VLGRVGNREGGLRGKRLDRARPLAEEIHQLEPLGRGQGLAEAGELLVDTVLESAMGVSRHQQKNIQLNT
jgi:hypothetical protein